MTELAQRVRDHVAQTDTARQDGPPTVEKLLEVQRGEIARALDGVGMSADRFARVVLTEVKRTPRLRDCTAASLLGAVMLAAQLGLEPGPLGLSYLVPRKNHGTWEVSFQIGYRGMIDLAMRSGMVREVAAHVVFEADEFEFEEGTEPFLRHRRSLDADRGQVRCAYAVARNTSGGAPFVVLSVAEIEARRARGAAGDRGPWVTDWPAMARKTAVRALEPYLPRSVELSLAVRADGAVVSDYTTANLADSDVLDVDPVDDEPEGDGSGESEAPPLAQGEPAAGGDGKAVAGATEAHLSPAVEPIELVGKLEAARLAVAAYHGIRKAGAAAAHRALDEFLATELAVGVDLDGLETADQADAIVAWLEAHPIGGAR